MPLQATSGAASYDAFGGGVPVVPAYIEEVFSCFLYTGTGVSRSITNGIDLSGKGGLVWTKLRSGPVSPLGHGLEDTTRGATKRLASNTTAAESTFPNSVTSFSSTGYVVGPDDLVNSSYGGGPNDYVSWTFRKQPKFFDIVTWTGDSTTRAISHNLGAAPGCMIVKRLNASNDWAVYHRATSATPWDDVGFLNLQDAWYIGGNPSFWGNTAPTSTNFTVGTSLNNSGDTYVAYLFAHNAGGFGLTGTDNVISCGIAANGDIVNLGYEPQWVLFKRTNGTSSWFLYDNMRGMPVSGNSRVLWPNLSDAENATVNYVSPNATGFNFASPGGTGLWIYIAIRRGPMKVPTDGTTVYNADAEANATAPWFVSGFPVDFAFKKVKTGATDWQAVSRLTGTGYLTPNSTAVENSSSEITFDFMNGWNSTTGANAALWSAMFRRAPSFMDQVCYTGAAPNLTVSHNLTVVPELIIVKRRASAGASWYVYTAATGNTNRLQLNTVDSVISTVFAWQSTTPTATVFYVGDDGGVNGSGSTYVAYLFATCPGISKVGSYTGNGSTQTINCGFTGGARFVLIKRTDSTGDWYTYDTARGMTVLTNPFLKLNTTGAEVATTGSVTTVATGFALNYAQLPETNESGGTYIFLAIA